MTMDEISEKNMPVIPQEKSPDGTTTEKGVSDKPPARRGILTFILLSIVVAILWILASRNIGRFLPIGTTPTPPSQEGSATPTPELPPSLLATQSAYMALATSVASLSADLRASVVTDQTLNPPVIDLPLGFTLK